MSKKIKIHEKILIPWYDNHKLYSLAPLTHSMLSFTTTMYFQEKINE